MYRQTWVQFTGGHGVYQQRHGAIVIQRLSAAGQHSRRHSATGARFTKYRTTILRKLRLTYKVRRPTYKTSYEECKAFLRHDLLAKLSKIGKDSVCQLSYDIPEKNFSTSQVTCDEIKIILRQIVRYFVNRAFGRCTVLALPTAQCRLERSRT